MLPKLARTQGDGDCSSRIPECAQPAVTPDANPIDECFEELYEAAPCGYISTLPEGPIIRVNRTFLSLTGYSVAELGADKRFAALLTMPAALLYETCCAPLLSLRGSINEIALDILCRDGKPLPVLLSAVVKKDAAGAPCLFRIVVMQAPTRRDYERKLLHACTQAEQASEQVRIQGELAERKVAEQQVLLEAVQRMTAGDLDTVVVVESTSSQALLAVGLDLMRQDIRKQLDELKTRHIRVQQLNVELRHQIEQRSRLMVESMQLGMAAGTASRLDYSAVEALPIFPNGTFLAARYRIAALVGQGAMGTVYEVERTSDGCRFAAKVLSVKPDYQAMARFAREAQLLARLQHPNLIAIVDADVTEDRVAYIVMELARGQSLAELGAYYTDCDFMLPVLLQIAKALTVVHEAGVVHRDLKPANVLIIRNKDGAPAVAKLVDFGVSRLLDPKQYTQDPAAELSSEDVLASLAARRGEFAATLDKPLRSLDFLKSPDRGAALPISESTDASLAQSSSASHLAQRSSRPSNELTRAGALLGTPLYMAPELLRGSNLALPPSDIFSFGVMAYEVLAGNLPFAELPLILVASDAGGLPFKPLEMVCPGLDSQLARFVERCLAMDPACRPTAGELSVALTRSVPPRRVAPTSSNLNKAERDT